MNLLRKMLGREPAEETATNSASGPTDGEKRVCSMCGRTYSGTPLAVLDLAKVGIQKRYCCPFCHTETNYLDMP
jgi:hypothetical protein